MHSDAEQTLFAACEVPAVTLITIARIRQAMQGETQNKQGNHLTIYPPLNFSDNAFLAPGI